MPRALSRHLFVLDQMQEKGFAKPEAIDEAKAQKIVLAPEPETTGELAPEVVSEVRRTLRELVGDEAQKGGYTITTTIDPKLQAEARKALRDNLSSYDKRRQIVAPLKKAKKPTFFEGDPATEKHAVYLGEVTGVDDAKNELFVRVGSVRGSVNLSTAARYNPEKLPASKFAEVGGSVRVAILGLGEADQDGKRTKAQLRLDLGPEGAIVAIDVGSRDILALAGSYEGLRSGLDRTSQAHRQPGSTFKPFVYSYAIHSKSFTAASLLPTSPTALTGHAPKNYDKSEDGAPVRLREALAKSINVSAQWTAERVGPANIAAWAHDIGIESKLGATPSIALGAYEVTPRELANSYATLAAGGMVEAPRLIEKIVGPNGLEVALPVREPKKRVMTEAEAFVTTDLLRSVIESGTGQAAKVLRRPIAGKTGTSNEVRDAWFAGYSTEIACVVWTGYDDPAPLGAGEAGARTSLPAFIAFMRAAHQGLPATEFPVPPGVVHANVDPKTGLLARPDQEDAVSEAFLAGTEPTDTAGEPDAGAPPSESDAGVASDKPDAGAPTVLDEEPPPPPPAPKPDGPAPTEGEAPPP
jgi:penicillin-binding protein 1A